MENERGEGFIKNNFIHITFKGLAKNLLWFLNLNERYDDGQGRRFDILDEELDDSDDDLEQVVENDYDRNSKFESY